MGSPLDILLKQTAILKRRTDPNWEGKFFYEDPVTIKCRKENVYDLVVSEKGEEREPKHIFYCKANADINEGDLLDDEKVLRVQIESDMDGNISHLEVFTYRSK